MKRLILILSIVSMLFIFTKPMFAETQKMPYEILENGIGLNKLNPDDIVSEEDQDHLNVHLNGVYKMPSNTIYAIYASYDFVGDISLSKDFIYTLWDTETLGHISDGIVEWDMGGWYAHTYIFNESDKDCYLYIADFGVHYGFLSNTANQNVIMQEVKNPYSEEFEGYEYKGYVPFHGENDGYKLSFEQHTLTVIEGTELSNDDLKELVILDGFYGNVEPTLIETDYEPNVGDYTATYTYESYSPYVLNIKVIADVRPSLDGPSVITINLSDWTNYTIDDLFDNYTPSYGDQSGKITLTEESQLAFTKAIGYPGNTELELVCTFTGGKVVNKNITLQVLNDGYYEIYVKNYILKTSDTNIMTEDEIKDYIDANLNFDLNTKIKNLEIISNDYKGNERRAGRYEVVFKYSVNTQDILSTLTIEVTTNNHKVNWINIIIPSVSLIAVCSMGIILIIQRRRQRRS